MIDLLSTWWAKTLLAGGSVAVAAASLGLFLVLRRMSLIGDGLSHISFGGVAAALTLGVAPIIGALSAAVLGALGVQRLRASAKVHADTAIALLSYTALGAGLFLVSVGRGFNVDVMSYLFGSLLSIQTAEALMAAGLSAIVVLFVLKFKRELISLAFDPDTARVSGVPVDRLDAALVVLTALTVVASLNVVGLLLASAMLVLPASTALQFRRGFNQTLILANSAALASLVAGLGLAYAWDAAPSGTIVLTNAAFFALAWAYNR